MNAQILYAIVAVVLLGVAIALQLKWHFISDNSTAVPRPYSFARVQLVWWTFIVFAAFITILIATGEIPTFNESTLILLGIGILTTGTATLIDISDSKAAATTASMRNLNVNQASEGFLLDILSDKDGISIHRLQAFIFNLLFGGWFIYKCILGLHGLGVGCCMSDINAVMPVITPNNLILLGLSSGAYVALKTAENKSAIPAPIKGN
ncbi:MAG: hypothetical protein JWO03_2281 [Bacteroidetes bacterium]|nr:hypothetical protein [Bacteroidota bacterium]